MVILEVVGEVVVVDHLLVELVLNHYNLKQFQLVDRITITDMPAALVIVLFRPVAVVVQAVLVLMVVLVMKIMLQEVLEGQVR
jgi:hypothetical protein